MYFVADLVEVEHDFANVVAVVVVDCDVRFLDYLVLTKNKKSLEWGWCRSFQSPSPGSL